MNVHFSSKSHEWETPQSFYDKLNEKYNFQLDPCCTVDNCKCPIGFTHENDGLLQDWFPYESVFMNPPYGREIIKWVKKAYDESQKGCVVVCLLPARTDTRWFHDYCVKGEIEFIRGRLKFGGQKNSAPFPSMVVVFGLNKEIIKCQK